MPVPLPAEWRSLPSSWCEARDAGSEWFFTGNACCNGHVVPRRTVNRACIDCTRTRTRELVTEGYFRPTSRHKRAEAKQLAPTAAAQPIISPPSSVDGQQGDNPAVGHVCGFVGLSA
jgi:hypothetical protein